LEKDFISSFSKKKTKGLLRSLFQDVIKGWKFSNLSIRFENKIRKEYQAIKFRKWFFRNYFSGNKHGIKKNIFLEIKPNIF
jgi:hypothetical protein